MPSKIPRGGVAVYANLEYPLNVELIYDGLRDCVVCHIRDTSIIIIALYIPPINSTYFNDTYFMNLELIYEKFNGYQIILTGDLNCRIGTPKYDDKLKYSINPDDVINTNGSKLLRWLTGKNFIVVNGLNWKDKIFDSKFTFYRGKQRSHNDLLVTNNIDIISSFKIMEKQIYSDHCPTTTTCNINPECSLEFIKQCSIGCFNDDHMDINKRKITPLKISKVDWGKALRELEEHSIHIRNRLQDGISNDVLNSLLSTSIYDICRKNYKKEIRKPVEHKNAKNCNSKNYKAIAQMNLYMFETHTQNGTPLEVCEQYLQNWIDFEQHAMKAEEKELELKKNSAWKNVRGDGKKMWKRIDWKGKAETKADVLIRDQDVDSYFRGIFQSEKTKDNPTISDIQETLQEYDTYIPILDDTPTKEELDLALKKLGSGCGLDGIPADVMRLMPPSIKDNIQTLIENTFMGDYPEMWKNQILNALPKDGHTSETPKLRGISIAPILARLYDCILARRFKLWYTPNREQAGFRSGQGCLLQIFILVLLIHHIDEKSLNLIILFMDYEKAFDFANRYELISKLMEKGCGAQFVKALAKMYSSTSYFPFVNNKIGEEIKTSHGVAQGRNSSPDLYSFYVSDMPNCTNDIETNDFMKNDDIAQLADDTAMLAELFTTFKEKTSCLLKYSKSLYQVPNIPKTVYCHFSSNPSQDPISIDENTSISSVDVEKGHRYLGVKFLPTNKFKNIIKFNLKDRNGTICKFYAWLEDNRDTPIEIKLLVLDCCLFKSLLYGVEAWGDISCIEKELRITEQKALKAILQIKTGTSNDLIYNELERPDIISQIRDLQHGFYQNIDLLTEHDAMVKAFIRICSTTSIIQYYTSLHGNNKADNIRERKNRISTSDSAMTIYYRELLNIEKKPIIYDSFMNDSKRNVITRWRLSNHKLRIETGRYNTPPTPRNERKCTLCDVVEDEFHAIFICPVFHNIRLQFDRIFCKHNSVKSILDPSCEDMYMVANLLLEIDTVLLNR